jgi:hypothetical protein
LFSPQTRHTRSVDAPDQHLRRDRTRCVSGSDARLVSRNLASGLRPCRSQRCAQSSRSTTVDIELYSERRSPT